MMDQKDMLPVLTNWRDTIRKADADIERFIDPLKCSPDSKLYDIPWTLMNAYTKAVSRAVGDRLADAVATIGAKRYQPAPKKKAA